MPNHTHNTDYFPTDTAGLPEAARPEIVELSDGDQFDLRIAPVAKQLGDATVRMLAYNGSIPGPTLKVREGSEVLVNIENQGDTEATVHWHGLRLENRYDGTLQTQQPMKPGETFSARVRFPDLGRARRPTRGSVMDNATIRLFEQLTDSGELVFSRDLDLTSGYDGCWYAWDEAHEHATLAYEAWCKDRTRQAYTVYLAAQERADAAEDALARQPRAATAER